MADSFYEISLLRYQLYSKRGGATICMIRFLLKIIPEASGKRANFSSQRCLRGALKFFHCRSFPCPLSNLGTRDVITHSEGARTHSGREEFVELDSFIASSSKTKDVLVMIWLTSQIGYRPSIIWPEVTSLKYKIRSTVWMYGTPLRMGRNLRGRRYSFSCDEKF